jgi:hypothetical protein
MTYPKTQEEMPGGWTCPHLIIALPTKIQEEAEGIEKGEGAGEEETRIRRRYHTLQLNPCVETSSPINVK